MSDAAVPEVAEGFRCGHVAIVGRPNVGKSTLMNRLLGQKLSITSRKPQTTRHRIVGIRTTARAQHVYVDTPGMHDGAGRAMNRIMNRAADGALVGVDVVVLLIEATGWQPADDHALRRAGAAGAPLVLAINKIDRLGTRTALLPLIADVSARGAFTETVPISAARGTNVDRLEQVVEALLPPGPPLYPEDQLTDRSERFLAAEIVREKLTRRLGEELPHRLGVEVEHFVERGAGATVAAIVWVEKQSQKGIVVGKGGERLKAVGTEARRDMAALFGRPVHLELWVKVRAGWSDDERALARLGYAE